MGQGDGDALGQNAGPARREAFVSLRRCMAVGCGLLLDEVRVRARRAHAALVAGRVGDVAAVVALDERLRGAQQGAWGATGASTVRRRRPRD